MYIPPLYTRTGTLITPEPPPNRGLAFKAAKETVLEIQATDKSSNSTKKLLPPPSDGRGSRVDILV
ncbi:hypothetical protein O4H49_14405 [Kiloniella laminariae]|uniref:Uncharacterized protein n=1 Tax=Kiloniella laminariae TaxID=454162 RepID=A0ABT4LLI4_9PROT|nr:hypothetical protein [Kiloniella laminariae]MCZ4281980.1 hypothetical protein [Kiloniella laminariae]